MRIELAGEHCIFSNTRTYLLVASVLSVSARERPTDDKLICAEV